MILSRFSDHKLTLLLQVNTSRTDAEDLLGTLYAQQETLKAGIMRMQNITNALIEEGQGALRKYTEITLEHHNEVGISYEAI